MPSRPEAPPGLSRRATRALIPAEPGQSQRYGQACERRGTADNMGRNEDELYQRTRADRPVKP